VLVTAGLLLITAIVVALVYAWWGAVRRFERKRREWAAVDKLKRKARR
jgi:hypothetical protein